MVERCLTIIGPLVSAAIDVYLIYHFFKTNCTRRYRQEKLYLVIVPGIVLLVAAINSLHNTLMNIGIWLIICFIFGFVLFFDETEGRVHSFFKGLVLYVSSGLIEIISYFILKFVTDSMNSGGMSLEIYNFLNLTITKVLNILFYFALLRYLLGRQKMRKLPYWYYLIYAVIAIVSMWGMFIVINAIEYIDGGWKALSIIAYLTMIVSISLFTLNLLDSLAENIELKIQLGIFEQQEILQERYYDSLDDRYNQSLKVLHDVDKHIRIIEGLYQKGENREAMEYTRDISKMLLPLVPVRYVSNDILNIILNDKAEAARKHGIAFTCIMEAEDYSFLKGSDITTIFANLLDNAIEACMKKEGERRIKVMTKSQYDILMVEIRNTMGEKPDWREGRPLSKKGGHHGIGLKNVEKVVADYEGSIEYEMQGEEFICNLILNK